MLETETSGPISSLLGAVFMVSQLHLTPTPLVLTLENHLGSL